jgi:hypothetical protein
MNDEFYIGWEAKAPLGIGSRVRRAVLLLLALAVAFPVLLAVAQRTIGVSVFEWGNLKDFSGVFQSQPYPHLLVPRPGAGTGPSAFSSYYLVRPFKFGLDPAMAGPLDGKFVALRGTLIYRGNQTMIEVADGTLKPAADNGAQVARALAIQSVDLGRQTLTGEIVDSKCFLGVMNPGQLEPHRACAIRCISGGIPPVLLVRQQDGPALYLLLVSADGHPVNQQVLDLVAEPVEITGDVVRQGDLLILRADPATYRRVAR